LHQENIDDENGEVSVVQDRIKGKQLMLALEDRSEKRGIKVSSYTYLKETPKRIYLDI